MRSLVVMLLLACGPKVESAAPTAAAPVAAASPPVEASSAAPFTAEQVRAAIPAGLVLRYEVRGGYRPTIPSPPAPVRDDFVRIERWEVTAADEASFTMAAKVFDASGNLLWDKGPSTTGWAEWIGGFAAQGGVWGESEVDVPAGHFRTWFVTVDKLGTRTHLHFARDWAGLPVLLVAEAPGSSDLVMSLLELPVR